MTTARGLCHTRAREGTRWESAAAVATGKVGMCAGRRRVVPDGGGDSAADGDGSTLVTFPHGRGGGEADSDGGAGAASAARAPPRRGAVVGGSRLGKAKEIIELKDDRRPTPEERLALLRRLTDEERATLRALLAKALATPAATDEANGAGGERREPVDATADDPVQQRRIQVRWIRQRRPARRRRWASRATWPRDRPSARVLGSGARVSRRGPGACDGVPATPPDYGPGVVVHPLRRTRPA